MDALGKLAARLGLQLVTNQVVQTQIDEERYILKAGAGFEEDVPAKLSYLIMDSRSALPQLTWNLVVKLPNNWFDVHVCARTGTCSLLCVLNSLIFGVCFSLRRALEPTVNSANVRLHNF